MMLSETTSELEQKLGNLAARWSGDKEVAAAFLFGSQARGNARPRSAFDLAVILAPDLSASQRWRKRLALLDQAAMALGTDAVDLIVLEEAPAPLAHRVIRDGRLVLDRDPHRRVFVVEAALRQYFDEAHLRAVLDEDLKSRLQEGRFAR
jgi:predicted nucleotidyltransferase